MAPAQNLLRILSAMLFTCLALVVVVGDDDHRHGHQDEEVKAPRIFLDKNPRIVKYQLGRLDNTRLLMVERKDDEPKYLLVHQEILLRDGMARGDRDQALQAIAKINDSDAVGELLTLIPTLDDSDATQRRVARQLAGLLLQQDPGQLKSHVTRLIEATKTDSPALQSAAFAGLITAGESQQAIQLAGQNAQLMARMLESIPLLPNSKLRNSLQPKVLASLDDSQPTVVRKSALQALVSIRSNPEKTFQTVSSLIENDDLRRLAVKVLLKIPREHRSPSSATKIAEFLVTHAEETPAAERTSDEFIEAMQLADQVLGLISKDQSDAYRKRLSAVTVRVVLIHTVEEEMRYDIPWFAVEAGRDVQVILKNEDLMAHNLVVTVPDALQDVALQAAAEGPAIGPSGKQYVPDSEQVLFATDMVQAEKQSRITFTAPETPGEYPYVCTFPGHWMRMYGVMVVVDNLAEFQRNPVEPKDPVGSNRPIVQAWTIDDLKDKIASGLRGRSTEIGKKIYNEATCALCHQVGADGKNVGPELTDVWTRWKGDAEGVLREILDPSHKIEPKYIVRKVITLDGEVISGIVVSEDNENLAILPNPESSEPTIIKQDDIDDMIKSSVSIMPKGLMDRFTEDEIFELLAYLKAAAPESPTAEKKTTD